MHQWNLVIYENKEKESFTSTVCTFSLFTISGCFVSDIYCSDCYEVLYLDHQQISVTILLHSQGLILIPCQQ